MTHKPQPLTGHIVDLVARRIYGGEIIVTGGKIDHIIEFVSQ